MYSKTIIIRFGFCDIQNKQGLSKGYQPQPSALANNGYVPTTQGQRKAKKTRNMENTK